jgi:hypothetical protein
MAETYRDGVQMERCLFCGQAVRATDGAPVVVVLASDLEQILRLRVTGGIADEDVCLRLLNALGLNATQLVRRAQAEAIAAHVRTDRSGLLIEE